jgi:hypothetical protein
VLADIDHDLSCRVAVSGTGAARDPELGPDDR